MKPGIYRYSQANLALFGGEAGLHFHPQALKLLHFETIFSSVIGKQDNGDYLPFVPAHKLNFNLTGMKDKFLFLKNVFTTLNSHIAFNQNNAAPDETTTPGYSLFDISIGGNISMKNQLASISLSVNNLFDTKYIDHFSALKEVNLYNPGRNIALSLKFLLV